VSQSITPIQPLRSYSVHYSYRKGEKLTGIIFLHDITQKRIAPSNRSLSMMHDLCGNDALNNVTLVTSMWESANRQQNINRETSLKSLWRERMSGREPKTSRFDNTLASAWCIIDAIEQNRPVITQLQRETVDSGNHISDTKAGRQVPLPKKQKGFWNILLGLFGR
jgi:hypothetical protein